MEEKNVNKKVKLTTRKNLIISITILLVVMFLGVNAFAATQGYNNIFFVIRNLFTNDVVAEKDEILLDRDITISYEFISIAEGLKVQVNNLKIKDGEAELVLKFKQEKDNNNTVPCKFIISDITNGNDNILSDQIGKITESSSNEDVFYEEYTEVIKLTNINNETNNLKLEIQDEDKNAIAVLQIKLEEKEIDVISSMATELEKLSETELKEILSNFALLNYYKDNKEFAGNEYTEQQLQNNLKIRIAHRLIQNIEDVSVSSSGALQFSTEKTNKAIEEFTGEKNGKDEVLDFANNAPYFYNPQFNCYEYIPAGGWPQPLCLEIEELTFENGVYTATFVYCIPSESDYMDNNIPNLAQYRTTMKFKVNEEYTYSKYCLIDADKIESKLIKADVREDIKTEEDKNSGDVITNTTTNNTTTDKDTTVDNNINTNNTNTNKTETTIPSTSLTDEKIKEFKDIASKYILVNYYKDRNVVTKWYTEEEYANEMKIFTAFKLDFGGNASRPTQFSRIDKSIVYDIINAFTGEEFNDNTVHSQLIIKPVQFEEGNDYFTYIAGEIYDLSANILDIEVKEQKQKPQYDLTFTYSYNRFPEDQYRATMTLKPVDLSGRMSERWVKYQLVGDIESEKIN